MIKRYGAEFKRQIVDLYNNGKPLEDINEEYQIEESTVRIWVIAYNNSERLESEEIRV